MATNYTLKAGWTLTATAGAVAGTCHQIEDASIGAVLPPLHSRSFGPYLVERNFSVADGVTVTTAASALALLLGGLFITNAGAPTDGLRASANVNPTGDDNGLTFTARVYGTDGNAIRVTYVDPGAADAALSVTVSGPSIVVSLATDGDSLITSTAAEVKAAIEASAPASALVSVAIMTSDSGSADDGTGVVTAVASTSLANGAGTGVGVAAKGGLCFDTTNGAVFINNGTAAAPDWDGLNEVTVANALYATAAQGALADTATQPGDLGTAAAEDVEAFVDASLHIANAGAPDDAVQATLSRNPAGNDNALDFTAVAYGTGGNSITIQYVDPSANNAALSVDVAASAITVNLATNGGGAITSTAADVLAAIQASGPASALVTVAIDTGDTGVADDGSGVVTALASAPMTGGQGTAIGSVVPGGLVVDTTNGAIYRNTGTQAVPTWAEAALSGWRDLTSSVSNARIPGANAPNLVNFGPASSLQRQEYSFDVNDYVTISPFHVNHDVKPGGAAYIHVHWSTDGTSQNTVKWELHIQQALGHNQAAFPATTVVTVEQAASGTAWKHMITEVAVEDALTLTEPDELVLVMLRRITNGGSENADDVYALTVDFHYQTDRPATPGKSPDFYAW